MAVKEYIRERFFPHMWCPGCGHGIVLNGLVRAVEELAINKNELVIVSGIGCSSRISGYVDFHSLHTVHGRASGLCHRGETQQTEAERHRPDGRRRRPVDWWQPLYPCGAA